MVSVLLCPYACSCLFAPALVSPVCETQIVKEALSYLRKKVCSFVEKSLPRSPSSTSSHSVALRTAAAATTAVAAPFLVWPSPQSPYVEQCRSAIRRLIDYNIPGIIHTASETRQPMPPPDKYGLSQHKAEYRTAHSSTSLRTIPANHVILAI